MNQLRGPRVSLPSDRVQPPARSALDRPSRPKPHSFYHHPHLTSWRRPSYTATTHAPAPQPQHPNPPNAPPNPHRKNRKNPPSTPTTDAQHTPSTRSKTSSSATNAPKSAAQNAWTTRSSTGTARAVCSRSRAVGWGVRVIG